MAGREFTTRDRDQSPAVGLVNETFVNRFFGGAAAGARRARAARRHAESDGRPGRAPMIEIVGVVGDTKQAFEAALQPTMFVPYPQHPIEILGGMYRNLSIVLKAGGDPLMLAGGLRAALREVDRDQPLVRVRTMDEAMRESVAQPRLRTTLLVLFSGVALALSLVGVYGVMAYAVSERTHELGVRIALGATPAEIRTLVTREGGRLAAAGIVIGIGGAIVDVARARRAAVRRQRDRSADVRDCRRRPGDRRHRRRVSPGAPREPHRSRRAATVNTTPRQHDTATPRKRKNGLFRVFEFSCCSCCSCRYRAGTTFLYTMP